MGEGNEMESTVGTSEVSFMSEDIVSMSADSICLPGSIEKF
jgi:hypothetical protein